MQQMRKEMDLQVDSYVHGYIIAPTAEKASMLQSKRSYLSHEVRAKRFVVATEKTELKEPYYIKTWQIDGGTYEFGLREVPRPAAKKLPTNKTAKKA